MYNEKQKKKYLLTINEISESSAVATEYSLISFEPIEKMLGKDLCQFSYQDFVMLFNNNRLSNISTFTSNKSNVLRYLKWCVQNGYAEKTVIQELERLELNDVSSSPKIKTEFFADEDDLLNCFDEVLGGEDTIYKYTFSVFYGLCWYGLSDDELFNAKAEIVNGNTISLENRKIIVSDKFAYILSDYLQSDKVCLGDKQYSFVNSRYLIKCIDMNKTSSDAINSNYHASKNKAWKRMTDGLPVNSNYYGKKLLPNKIRQSGAFYRLWQKEKNGIEVTSGNIVELLDTDSRFVNSRGYLVKRDYDVWKKEFAK